MSDAVWYVEYFDFRRHRFVWACCLWRWGGWQVLGETVADESRSCSGESDVADIVVSGPLNKI